MKFSQRYGHAEVRESLQTGGVSPELVTSLWNVIYRGTCNSLSPTSPLEYKARVFACRVWDEVLHAPVVGVGNVIRAFVENFRREFFLLEWHQVYDVVEIYLETYSRMHFIQEINGVLERECAGYRYIQGHISPITGKQEIEALESALGDSNFPGVQGHLDQALAHLADRESPDFRNSMKESISAVEAIARKVSGKEKATLGDALDFLEKKGKLHPALKLAYSKLYGYTNDADGIRHAMEDEPNLGFAEAKFFLLSCTSFINYLKTKM